MNFMFCLGVKNNMNKITYYLSCNNHFDGKSVNLWRADNTQHTKIARFLNDEVARQFAEEFKFPLSEKLKARLGAYNND